MARSPSDVATRASGTTSNRRATAAATAPTERPWPVAPRTVAIMATVLSGALTVFHLGHKSFWLDEGYSVGHARMPWSEFWTILTQREPNGALHALLLFPMIRVSDAEWWLRLPSAVCATATVPLLYLLIRRLVDERVAAIAALLFAVNAFGLQFAQEVRAYALVMCLGTASTLAFVAYVQDRRPRQWWTWVAISAVLPYAHLFGWLILGVQAAAALARQGDLRRPARRLVAGFALIGLLGGLVLVLIATAEKSGQADGIPGVTVVRYIGVYARVGGNGGPLLLAVVGALWLVAVVGVVQGLRPLRPFRPSERDWGVLLLVLWLVLPPIAIAILSPVQPLFGARYFVILVPPAAGLTAVGLQTLPSGWVRRGATTVLAVLLVAAAVGWYLRPPADDLQAAAATVSADVEPGDAVVFLPWFVELPFDPYALQDDRLDAGLTSVWPEATWGLFVPDHADHPSRAEIAREVASHDRIWLVVRDDRDGTDDRDLAAYDNALALDHVRVQRIDLDGVDVTLFERG